MSTTLNQVRRGFFLDSVALMRISRTIAGLASVEEAALMMGTPANKQILAAARLLANDGEAARGGDLILAVRAIDPQAAEAALAEAGAQLELPKTTSAASASWRPRTLGAAVDHLPGANLALISVPGDFAAAEARKALRRGLNVMIFSDNVPLAEEVALKQEARHAGLLVMGPDCGTAIIGGVPLAFANAVPRGDIGIIGASGTGMQEVATLIARGGAGISHALGVGGRDLKAEVGGLGTLAALDLLEGDPATGQVVLISKPPAPEVAAALAARIARSAKAYTLCLIGEGDGPEWPVNARLATTLKAAAESALGTPLRFARPEARPATGRLIRGLFAGGTLAAEAQVVLRQAGQPVASNAPIPGALDLAALDLAGRASAHRLLDLGEDDYTRGRPHPMIDPGVRDAPLAEALADPATGVVLLDLVIGHGAAADPAGHLAAGLNDGGPPVVASVTGTEQDPQVRSRQVAALEAAGVLVAPSNADAAQLALDCLAAGPRAP